MDSESIKNWVMEMPIRCKEEKLQKKWEMIN